MSPLAWLLPARLVLPAELGKHLAPATLGPRRGLGRGCDGSARRGLCVPGVMRPSKEKVVFPPCLKYPCPTKLLRVLGLQPVLCSRLGLHGLRLHLLYLRNMF